ncbi:hypothetical protein Btru_052772 [Bulinus truncatus]|nr:hypothetical protein Btru_052772 [Bulinus truncatus]
MNLWSTRALVTLALLGLLLMLASGQEKVKQSKEKRKLRENNARRNKKPNDSKPNSIKPANGNKVTGPTSDQMAKDGCEEIILPMCKGLVPYTHTKLPNQFNHTTQGLWLNYKGSRGDVDGIMDCPGVKR